MFVFFFLGTSGIAVSLIGREDESFLEDLQNKGVTIDQLPGIDEIQPFNIFHEFLIGDFFSK